jgi:putative ABC transport system ATP-binding protein
MTVSPSLRLRATGLELRFASRAVLNHTNLVVEPGELVAVTGSSGAGKTTLLLVAAGALAPERGEVVYEPAGEATGHEGWRAEVALVPQTLALSGILTVAENVALLLHVARVGKDELRERVKRSLAEVGLSKLADRKVTELSGGQRQRVSIARALAADPRILVADEATAELDGENQEMVLQLLQGLAGQGCAVLIATHDQKVVEHCSSAYEIDDGTLRPSS